MHVTFDDGTVAEVFSSELVLGGVHNWLEVFANNHRTRCNLNPVNALETYNPCDDILKDVYVTEKIGTKQGWTHPAPEEDWQHGYPQEFKISRKALRPIAPRVAAARSRAIRWRCFTALALRRSVARQRWESRRSTPLSRPWAHRTQMMEIKSTFTRGAAGSRTSRREGLELDGLSGTVDALGNVSIDVFCQSLFHSASTCGKM